MLTFNLLLHALGIAPSDVRLLRHEARERGRTAYALWRDDRTAFEGWQSIQLCHRRSYFTGRYWASFVITPSGKTIFVGLYRVEMPREPLHGETDPFTGGELDPAVVEIYPTTPVSEADSYTGRLAIAWGAGARTWVQRADRQNKPILELQTDRIDPPFPGFAAFSAQLSEIESLPPDWRTVLTAGQGVYLLTCPRTREQYVGSATGGEGFLSRWLIYTNDGHGGNLRLRSREPADYRISILQVTGSADDRDAVLVMEALWKRKLQSREMGLNAN